MPEQHPDLLNGQNEILEPTHTAVIVVDMQNDFCAKNGYIHATQGADMSSNKPLAKRIGELIEAGRTGVPGHADIQSTMRCAKHDTARRWK